MLVQKKTFEVCLPPNTYVMPMENTTISVAEKIGVEKLDLNLADALTARIAGGDLQPLTDNIKEAGEETLEKIYETIKQFDRFCTEENALSPLNNSIRYVKMLEHIEKTEKENQGKGNKKTIKEKLEELEELDKYLSGNEKATERQLLDIEGRPLDDQLKLLPKRNKLLEELSKSANEQLNNIKGQKITSNIGQERERTTIENLSEMAQKAAIEHLYPKTIQLQRLAINATAVRAPREKKEPKQILYILQDISGSMQQPSIRLSKEIILGRLLEVAKGKSIVYLRLFDGRLYEEHYADSKETAKALMKYCETNIKPRGSTNLEEAIKKTSMFLDEIVREKKLSLKPQILAITDGGVGEISYTENVVINYVRLEKNQNDRSLVEAVKATNGIVIDVSQ